MVPDRRDEKQDNERGKVERNDDKSRYYDGKREEERSQVRKYHHTDRYCDEVEKVRSRDQHRSCDTLEDERNHGKHKRSRAYYPDKTAKEVEYKRKKTDGNDGHLHSAKSVTSQLQYQRGHDRSENATRHSSLKETKDSLKRKRSIDFKDKWFRRQSEPKSSRVDKQSLDSRRMGGSTSKKWKGPSKASKSYSPAQSSEESVSITDIEKSTEFEDRIINRRVRLIGKDLEDEVVQASNRRIPHSTQRCRLR